MTIELVGGPCDGEHREYPKTPAKVFVPRTNGPELLNGIRRDAVYCHIALDGARLYYAGDDVMAAVQ